MNGKDLEIGSAMLKTRIIDIEKARGNRTGKPIPLKPSPVRESGRRTICFIFSGFKKRWTRMTHPGPDAA